jgi:hypothetical protein
LSHQASHEGIFECLSLAPSGDGNSHPALFDCVFGAVNFATLCWHPVQDEKTGKRDRAWRGQPHLAVEGQRRGLKTLLIDIDPNVGIEARDMTLSVISALAR